MSKIRLFKPKKIFVSEAFQVGVDDIPNWFCNYEKVADTSNPDNIFLKQKDGMHLVAKTSDYIVKDISGNISVYSEGMFEDLYVETEDAILTYYCRNCKKFVKINLNSKVKPDAKYGYAGREITFICKECGYEDYIPWLTDWSFTSACIENYIAENNREMKKHVYR